MASQDTTKSDHPSVNVTLSAATAAAPSMMQSLLAGQRDVLSASQQMVEENFRFAMKRIDAQKDFFTKLAAVKNPDDFIRLQTAFWNTATADYSGEFKTVAQSVQEMVGKLKPPVPKQAA